MYRIIGMYPYPQISTKLPPLANNRLSTSIQLRMNLVICPIPIYESSNTLGKWRKVQFAYNCRQFPKVRTARQHLARLHRQKNFFHGPIESAF